MKVSKMTAAGIVLLIGASFAPSVIRKISGDGRGLSDSPTASSSRTVSSTRVHSVEQLFENYPLAHDRLEELYQKYPNLRPRELELAKGETLVGQLNLLYEDYAKKRKWLEPSLDINYQLTGRKERNEEMIRSFFEERRDFTDGVIRAAGFSVLGSKGRHSIYDDSQGPINLSKAMKWLRLQFSQSLQEGNLQFANRVMEAFLKLEEAGSRPPLVLNLWSSSEGLVMREYLARSGSDVSRYVEDLTQRRDGEFFIESMRREIAKTISLFETARQVKDREALSQHLSSIYGGLDGSKSQNFAELFLLREEMEKVDFHDLQDDYARVSSRFIETLTLAREAKSLDRLVFAEGEFDRSQFGLSIGRELLLDRFGITLFSGIVGTIIKNEQVTRELMTLSAIQQASTSGEALNSLEDLVPRYLPTVPVNAETGQLFSYDPEAGGMSFFSGE